MSAKIFCLNGEPPSRAQPIAPGERLDATIQRGLRSNGVKTRFVAPAHVQAREIERSADAAS